MPSDVGFRRYRIMGGRYRGNRQKWFAMWFTGSDADINLATEHPEFDAWKWVKPEQLPELVVPFMRRLYLDILVEFREFWLEPAGRRMRISTYISARSSAHIPAPDRACLFARRCSRPCRGLG